MSSGLGAAQGRSCCDRQDPATLQLRYLQTLLEIGSANNSTIVSPIPIDLPTALSKLAQKVD